MSLKDKYSDELSQINNAPAFNKKRAIKRFFLLKDFEDNFEPFQREKQRTAFSHTRALEAYAELSGISLHTLFRWKVAYRKHGIKGLLPKYGTIRNPSKHRIRYQKQKMLATIAIDLKKPLKCLETLQQIIQRCRFIEPEVKHRSVTLLKQFFEDHHEDHPLRLRTPLTEEEIKILNKHKVGLHKKYSPHSAAILLINKGHRLLDVMNATGAGKTTVYRWMRNFNKNRLESITVKIYAPERERMKKERQTRIIDIIHKMPSLYGINRTTWTYEAIAGVYEHEYGEHISTTIIRHVIKTTGYHWQHARKVWTSPDPDYKAKIERVLDTLRGLKEGERFFFIDEVGPYKVKKYGGRLLLPKDHTVTLPEHQRSRGRVQFVAALEAVTNQLTWKFTADKSATSVIELIETLTLVYADSPAIFLTWDAISVHGSKAVMGWISTHNEAAKGPYIEVVPLPSKSQFLNVIESVFGGMKKAVICNSDYATPAEMQGAIGRHFEERNQYYRVNPKRAGNKIWDKQAFDIDKLIGGLFKKM